MVGEGTTAITITFLLAIIGYVGLTATVLLLSRGALPRLFWRSVAAVILAHVIMVWTFRFHGSFELATRNGYAGFTLFHGALVMILVSTVVPGRLSSLLIRIAFVVVTIGAVGAVFLYEVVAIYRVPVIGFALVGMGALIRTYLMRKRGVTETRRARPPMP